MNCTRHFLFLKWDHHDWHRSVSWADNYVSRETDMWGRTTARKYVTCQKQSFCSRCGATKDEAYCGCDKAHADQCPLYREWVAGAPETVTTAARPA
jgi:hypothetical protein